MPREGHFFPSKSALHFEKYFVEANLLLLFYFFAVLKKKEELMPYPKVILKLSVNTYMYFARKVHQFVTSILH